MGPLVDQIETSPRLPARVDVAVIGGGIIGTSAALELAERGISVALCEKGDIAGEQSSRNWGWVRKARRDPREIPLIIESLRLWESLNERVEADTGFRRTGIVFACDTAEDVALREAWLKHAEPYQMDVRMIGPDALAELLPGTTHRFRAALYCPSDGRAEPQKAAPAIAAAARRRGASVHTRCAVRGIECKGGRIAGVVTEQGPIACSSVLLAGGAWSGLFLGNLGLRLSQLKVMNSVLRTAPVDNAPTAALWTPGFALRKRLDGGYTIADGHANTADIVPDSFRFFSDFLPALRLERASLSLRLGGRFFEEWRTPRRWPLDRPTVFERVRVLDPEPVTSMPDRALRRLSLMFPAFSGAKVEQRWAGLIDVTPDAVPVISGVPAIPGLFVATGFSGHGFGIGPGAGRLAADLVTGRTPIVDPQPFRFARFSDGSRPRPVAGL